ncbi:MAG: tRNA uridine-5-carboxymethylaminomethyl(34) synthesis enzyme MnmG [Acidobacteria bacterium]|nr:tRNA uridine-5-carboxymethylaminomethyl(34) synthesis enzyme MnmG [Acidobacteriota bacterium]
MGALSHKDAPVHRRRGLCLEREEWVVERHLVVIGGGHAGIEAAHIAARVGVRTTLLTMNLDQIGQMSCNPSIGGVGKGHMVRELDALGGIMGRLIDRSGIHFRVLNESRGMAVRGPRAQADKARYRQNARFTLDATEGLHLRQGAARDLVFESGGRKVRGVRLLDGSLLSCDAVVLTSGTFLNGQILVGDQRIDGGRAGEPASTHLAQQLAALGLRGRRLKTGTSPRIAKRTVEFGRLTPQPGDDPPRPFSFFSGRVELPQVPCHIVHTTARTEAIVRENLHRSSMYGGHVEGVGPRYCPSIEDKFVKFPDKERHQIFVEPEGLEAEEIYLSGLSTSLPVEVQEAMVRSLPGFERAEIRRPGYAIEYDSFDPLQLGRDLRLLDFEGLWLAGQVNGTTGYEEAAGQGLVAGVNAARWLLGKDPVVLGRNQAYIGVMIDDLVTKGTDEPYRMLTARAEQRLSLACDLADERLLPAAREIGALRPEELDRVAARSARRARLREVCDTTWVTPASPAGRVSEEAGLRLQGGMTLSELLLRQHLGVAHVDGILAGLEPMTGVEEGWNPGLERDLLLFDLRYHAYREREARLLEVQGAWDHVHIPADFRVEHLQGISREVREKLARHRPQTLGQASRIPGVTPAAVTLLHLHLRR